MEWRNDVWPPAYAPRDRGGISVHRYPPGFAPSPPFGAQGPGQQGPGRSFVAGSGSAQLEDRPTVNQGVHLHEIAGGSLGQRNQVAGRRPQSADGGAGSRNGYREATADSRPAPSPSRHIGAPPGFQGQHFSQNVRPSDHPSLPDLNSIGGGNGGASSEARQVQLAPAEMSLGGALHGGNREDPGTRLGGHSGGVSNGRGRGAGSSNGPYRTHRGRGFGNPGRARYMPNLHGGGGSQNAAGHPQDGSSSLQVSLAAARDAATEALNGISLNTRNGVSHHFQPGSDRNGRAGVNGTVNWRVVSPSTASQPVAFAEGPLNPMRGFPTFFQSNGRTSDETSGEDFSSRANSAVPHLVQELQEKLTNGQLECMICYDTVGRKAAVWSCASCYSVFHLACIKKWARAPTSADLSVSGQGQAYEGNWRCPGCQSVQLTSAKDLRYECFCGQVEGPEVNYYLTPHSCGDTCKKALDKGKIRKCQHQCTMQCHPGPCPPCMTLLPPHPCPCGKTTLTQRCSDQQKGPDSCGQICGHTLLCGRHSCRGTCHDGPCDVCKVGFTARCFCGKREELTICGKLEFSGDFDFDKGLFSCGAICGAMLPCGHHQCMKRCHEGNCGECELSLSQVQTCPCGKQSLQLLLGQGKRTSCVDPIPTCGEVCGKLLPCKKHMCESACHMGPCPECTVPSEQKCRCGSSTRSVPCHVTYEVSPDQLNNEESDQRGKDYLCERNCGKKKNCGRHRCNSRCCKGAAKAEASEGEQDPHMCVLKCGKKLRCKQHDCQELCHSGHCPPCLESTFTELSCACGGTSVLPPVPCGTPLPSCQYPCSIPQGCGHMPTHLCHFGDCPPCSVPVAKECVGNHVVLRGVPCGSREIKCTNHCGKPRHCGLHACARTCHAAPCDMPVNEPDNNSSSSVAGKKPRASCGQPCGAPRRDCSHTCSAACHPSTSCPESRCRVSVTITCSCGRLTADVPCDAGGSKSSTGVEAVLPPHLTLQPTEGSIRVPLGQRKLACDDKCAKIEKKRVLADAFGAVPPGEPMNGAEGGLVGSELLAEVARREPQWIAAVEDRFKYLLLGLKAAAGGVVRVHVFCHLPRERREVIHQLGDRWGLAVTGVGREPRRFLVAYVTAKSKAPARSLITRAPLPSAGQALAPLFNPAVDMEPGLVVALFELPREADVSTLVLRFGGECELVWVNDKNALAVFGDAARAATALRRVDHATAYRGAVVMSQAGSSVYPNRPNPWGPSSSTSLAAAPGVSSSKAPVKKKGPKGSTWVEDAWGEESAREESRGAWQRKQGPVLVSRNPWGALEQAGGANDFLQQPQSSSRTSGIADSDGMGSDITSPVITTQVLSPPPMAPADVEDDWEKAAD